MPWTAATFRARHNKALSASQSKGAAKQANAILKKTGDEGMAIAVANKNAKKKKLGRAHSGVTRTALDSQSSGGSGDTGSSWG